MKAAQRLLQIHFVRFLMVGAIGFGLTLIAIRFLHSGLGIGITMATLLSSEVGTLSNFFFHEKWTYNSVDHHHTPLSRKFIQFHMSSWTGMIMITILETVAVNVLHFEYFLSFIAAGIITMFWNFFWTKFYIFRGRTPAALGHPEDTVLQK